MFEEPISGRFHSLDALRGVAALMVVTMHVGSRLPASYHLAQSGYLAVDFFFLLSGFVIAHAYRPRLRAGLPFLDFAALRAVRLYPLIALGVAIGAAHECVQLLTGSAPGSSFGSLAAAFTTNMLVLPTPHGGYLFPLNPPEWSLFTEICINLLFAALLFKLRWQTTLAIAVTTVATMLAQIGWSPGNSVMTGGWGWRTGGIAVTRTLFSFSLGIVIFHLSAGRPRRRSHWVLPLIGAALILLLALPASPRWSDSLYLASVVLVFPTFLWLAASYEPSHALTAASAWLGDLSYPLYAIHFPLLALYASLASGHEVDAVPFSMGFFVLSIAAAYLAMRYYDAPLRRWISHRLKQRQSARPLVIDPA